jgi:hypothetical protein
MRYLFTLYHPKKRSYTHLPLENKPDTIPTMYYIADVDGYEKVKARQKQLSQLSWFIERDFDEEEEEMYLGMSDEEYFLSIAKNKAINFIQELQAKWFSLLKSSKKTVEVYLFGESPLRRQEEHFLGNDLKGNIQIYLSTELMEKLVESSQYRVHLPTALRLEPEFDLFMALDFKMFPWRKFLFDEVPIRYSEKWMHWLWTGRNQGIARFPALETGTTLEMNTFYIRNYLGELMQKLIYGLENNNMKLSKFHLFLNGQRAFLYQISPQLMLHAATVYFERHPSFALGNFLKTLRSSTYNYDHKDLIKVLLQSRKIDFHQWLEYLTLPTHDFPPMIQADVLKKLNRLSLSLDGKNSIFQEMLMEECQDRFQLKLSLQRDENFKHPYTGVRVELNSSILSRFQVLAETWT